MLLATRREQAVIVENRIFLKQQQDARRENDFRDALNRQREQAAEEKLAFAALITAQATRAIDDQVERSALRSAAHQKMCRELVTQVFIAYFHLAWIRKNCPVYPCLHTNSCEYCSSYSAPVLVGRVYCTHCQLPRNESEDHSTRHVARVASSLPCRPGTPFCPLQPSMPSFHHFYRTRA